MKYGLLMTTLECTASSINYIHTIEHLEFLFTFRIFYFVKLKLKQGWMWKLTSSYLLTCRCPYIHTWTYTCTPLSTVRSTWQLREAETDSLWGGLGFLPVMKVGKLLAIFRNSAHLQTHRGTEMLVPNNNTEIHQYSFFNIASCRHETTDW
jgi:hypothetical protein